MEEVTVRGVCPEDLERVTAVEAVCFPAAEAATRESFQERIAAFPEYFFVAEVQRGLIGFINGCVTNSPVIFDEMFHSTSYHIPNGENLTVFGLTVIPEYRKQGVAAQLMQHFIQTAKNTGKRKVILTCKERLVPYYESFGYAYDGISASTHGGAQWFDMTLVLKP
ncbi:GNAT family N-acetyltransferase [Sporomusa acidovorans]|uniref:N-acetyltransferase domain-containing protein n=1 Tax=Sporomusa acidovorans (strain ATCC 49682 / DSM 3132 / Mol) TaxID=1123286 RepID=A0ABZ3J8V1_SPOA4|nr:GNAT family N-acetyltransferase [Sporomusa acidovorans]OZC16158.1 acetyltransferase (GNAT) family protein [Sporomusa acidovorans DSM 3132]SDE29439.1 Ribosomal protein S18 acetylase RimI [Sporomusa acidovorans]